MRSCAEQPGEVAAAILVLAYGNPLRGDDGVGWQAGQRIAALKRPDVKVVLCQQLLPELVLPLSAAAWVIFLDACCLAGQAAGQIRCREISPAGAGDWRLGHFLDPPMLLSLAQALYGRAPRGVLFTVGTAVLEHRQELSAPVAAALPQLVDLVDRRIRAIRRSLPAGDRAPAGLPRRCDVPRSQRASARPGRPRTRLRGAHGG